MNNKRYTYVLYIITLVIIITIGIQVYWNYNNYLNNKQQLITDVQVSLDKAVDDYYANLAKETHFGITFKDANAVDIFNDSSAVSKLLGNIDSDKKIFKSLDAIDVSDIKGVKIYRGYQADSLQRSQKKQQQIRLDSLNTKVNDLKLTQPSKELTELNLLSTKIFISIKNDTLDVKKVNKLLNEDFERKGINIKHNLLFFNNKSDEITSADKNEFANTFKKIDSKNFNLKVESKSTFLPKNSALWLSFRNETFEVLKRSFGGILISTLLILAVISCLFYLLKIIKNQKQLAELKNDLISNITHEFKTPIATIGVALESINNFNVIEDKEKTKQYVDLSSNQLSKLNLMVEKLLETATLDSDELQLKKEDIDVLALLRTLKEHHQMQDADKTIETHFKVEKLMANVDVFHFENAINNILDNAIKYGGNHISIDALPTKSGFQISISDNGNTLKKVNVNQIFEKFYRVPKGNTHDIKGFGIGLYYTKSIVEKHGGEISVNVTNHLTTFKIEIPNG